ncbi:MAG: hypothetical protein II896_00255 [Clostridia bacterium]|nr:hypothetical protein [Clostridia bacterium]
MENRKLNWQVFPIELIVLTVYLAVGFTLHLWHPTWLVFLAIPLYHWTVDIIRNKRIKGLPTFLSVWGSTVVYLAVGFSLGIWHPTWLVFMSVPIVGGLEGFFAGGIRGQINKTKDNIKKKIIGEDKEGDHADIE